MRSYLVRFTPTESYFFGDERSFAFPLRQNPGQQGDRRAIEGEDIPSQTTLFGALRYLLLPIKHGDRTAYTPQEQAAIAQAVGPDSFDMDAPGVQRFGGIRAMSPVFLLRGEERLVPMPADHVVGEPVYTPFRDYRWVATPDGWRLYTPHYDPKKGITTDFLSLGSGKAVPREALLTKVTRVGHSWSEAEPVHYRRERTALQPGCSFGVYVLLEDTLVPRDGTLRMGQGGAAFCATFTPQDNLLARAIRARLPGGTVYCFGDMVAFDGMRENTLFAATRTRTYRALRTQRGQVSRGQLLHQTVRAGSVFIPRDIPAFLAQARACENYRQIGFNTLITQEEESL